MTDKTLFTPFTADNHPIPDGILDDYTEQEKADYANEWAAEIANAWIQNNAPDAVEALEASE